MALKELSDGGPDGTRLGQSSTDKIGFYGLATPIARPATVTDATDATTAITAVNTVIDRLQALGLIASS
jgi:hypothetical protein